MDNLKEVTHIPTASTITKKVKQEFLLLNVLYLGGHFSVEYTPVFYFEAEEEEDDEKSTAAADDNERSTAAARTTPCRARTSSGVMVLGSWV